ncbi:glycosyltransferase family 2 protein, partial [bacterium]|nr:glycosyltransferase family 2 protein [bacterium]
MWRNTSMDCRYIQFGVNVLNTIVAIPVFNEANHVHSVLEEVRKYANRILVIDDGSTDGTSNKLDQEPGIERITHEKNKGYGAALISAFEYSLSHNADILITMDCD